MKTTSAIALCFISHLLFSQGNIIYVENKNGQRIAYHTESGVKILKSKGLQFKDLNKNGKLDKYEDWRLSAMERAKNLASTLTIEEIAGLMLYSRHQSIPGRAGGFFAATYNGLPLAASGQTSDAVTDQQKDFLIKDNLRHILITIVQSPEIAAKWNNNVQAFCERLGKGIPANNSSDPRHGTIVNMEYNATEAREISIAGGDPLEASANRSYKDKRVKASNLSDLHMIYDTYAKMNGKPVIVSVSMDNPMVFNEFERLVDGLIINFKVQDQAQLDIISGKAEPSALLPMQMPATMKEVETQAEDAPQDMKCHIDSENHSYDFGFGLNWSGVINDQRLLKYRKK